MAQVRLVRYWPIAELPRQGTLAPFFGRSCQVRLLRLRNYFCYRRHRTMEVPMSQQTTEVITYVDSMNASSFDFAPGSRWKILFEDPQTGQRAMLVEWEPGYQMGGVDYHEADEIVFVLSGTFVQEGTRSRNL